MAWVYRELNKEIKKRALVYDLSVFSGLNCCIGWRDVAGVVWKVLVQPGLACPYLFRQQILNKNKTTKVRHVNSAQPLINNRGVKWGGEKNMNLFVEEEDDGDGPEPTIVPNGFKKVEGLA